MSTVNERYHKEYTKDFAERWDDLIDWDGRREGESQFFESLLSKHNVKTVADVACGTGYHAITLAQRGFDVYATDGAKNMVDQTGANAREHGVDLVDVRQVDWRELKDVYGENKFDALLCLGNAFTHLFEHDARVESLRSMNEVLRPGGVLAVDQRNYDVMLEEGYSSKHSFYYTSEEVNVEPVSIDESAVLFEYTYPDGEKFHLRLFPLKQDYLSGLLADSGFEKVKRYGDFEKPYGEEVDFIQQIAIKRSTS